MSTTDWRRKWVLREEVATPFNADGYSGWQIDGHALNRIFEQEVGRPPGKNDCVGAGMTEDGRWYAAWKVAEPETVSA